MDYELQHVARCCSVSGKEFQPGEMYYSTLVEEGMQLKRLDYSVEAWPGPSPESLGWWKSQVPDRNNKKKHWAPNDVMLDFWDGLADQPARQDIRYVLTLLLIRRRVFQLEEETTDEAGCEVIVVYSGRRDETYRVPATAPEPLRIQQIQDELASLLK
jgi:hypothetical protein